MMLGVHINRLAAPEYTKMKPPRTREPLEIWSNPGERRDQPLIFHPINATAPQAPHHLTEERTFQLRFEITKPEPKTKPKKVRKPKHRKPRERKPKVPTRTAEEQIQARRDYDKARSQTPERKEAARLHARQVLKDKKERGQCRVCPNEAIPGQTCRDKHNQSRNQGANRKPRAPKLTPEERIERRQEYERARAQTPERKEATRLRSEQRRQERVAALG